MYTKLIKHWQLASNDLNISIDLNFSVPLKSGGKIKSVFIVEKFGAKKGMLVLREGTDVSQHTEELNQLGYGYTFLSEPSEYEEYSVEDYAEILDDWGWSGDPELKPFELVNQESALSFESKVTD